MSKHYTDARYYLGRAVAHARQGLREDLQPVTNGVKRRLGFKEPEAESDSSRVTQLRLRLQKTEQRLQNGLDGLLTGSK